MDYKYYERKINDIIMKCPIEAGIEILAYNILDNIISSKEVVLVDINRIRKNRDDRLTTDAGIPDMAILSKDFKYKTTIGKVYGFVEVKATNKHLSETLQIKCQKNFVQHYLYTNGLVWKYYENGNLKWTNILASYKNKECEIITTFHTISINQEEFENLKYNLNKINWTN